MLRKKLYLLRSQRLDNERLRYGLIEGDMDRLGNSNRQDLFSYNDENLLEKITQIAEKVNQLLATLQDCDLTYNQYSFSIYNKRYEQKTRNLSREEYLTKIIDDQILLNKIPT